MKVSDVMNRYVKTVLATDGVDVAMQAMLQDGFSGLPVLDAHGRLVGMLTEGDLMHRAETGTGRQHPRWLEYLLGPGRFARDYVVSHARKVGELMTPEVICVDPAMPLTQAVEQMEKHHIKRLPVLEKGRLVGILSRADLMRAFLRSMSVEPTEAQMMDDALTRRVEQDIRQQSWLPRATVQVSVKNRVCELRGVITDDSLRDALRVLAENVPGITGVLDGLTTIEPMTGFVVHAAPDQLYSTH